MVPFSEIVERVKDIVSPKYDRKVFDKDVANELGLHPNSLRAYKATNHIPYRNVIIFCMRHDISVDWMLFDSGFEPKKLPKSTNS